jgi:cytochrome c-type biogenesis protein CcmH/NrfG
MLAKEYAGIGANTQAESFSAQALTVAVTRVNDAPTDADGYYWLGRVYQERDEIEKARRAYEQALAIEPQRSRYILALRSLSKVTGVRHQKF